MLAFVLSTLLVQTVSAPQPAQASPGPTATQTWTGCVQAGSAPSTYRLNLDEPRPTSPEPKARAVEGTQGRPYLQLVADTRKLDLTKYVGKRVRVTGRELTEAEAEKQAAQRPNRQEAAETVAGTGGITQQHERYVRIDGITPAEGECR